MRNRLSGRVRLGIERDDGGNVTGTWGKECERFARRSKQSGQKGREGCWRDDES